MNHRDDDDFLDEEQDDEIHEAYCVRCRETIEMEDPEPVWTRKGLPATRGICPSCGGIVFRLGKTAAHMALSRPSAVKVAQNTHAKLPQETIYLAYAPSDELLAEQIAADLQKMGVACWLHEADPDPVKWAGGVHPALKECARMILLLSPAALEVETVEAAWRFFKDKNKPILIAQAERADPPDAIRRKPRFDFAADYKSAFRQMMQALHE
jgi:hypothetical protein